MRIAKILLCLLVAALSCWATSSASAADTPAFKRWYDYDYTFRSAELRDATVRIETEVGAESLVQSLGQYRLANNDRFFDLQIVEAATIKPDGRRIDVQPDQIAVVSGAEAATNILFYADIKTRVVPFPELAAGDRTVLVFRVIQKESLGRGGSEIMMAFPPQLYFTSLKVAVHAPKDLPLQLSERALEHETVVANGQQTLRWQVDEQPYAAGEANTTAPIDWAPMLMVSTYPSWEAIGNAEFASVDARSQPDQQVSALADQITHGLTDRRAQAAAIFDWVARNIRYYNIMLNQGGFVPHDAGQILKNRYGDCKDHATLMRALLRAKGIAADYVLINAQQNIYRAYDIPMFAFDHMMLYLPEFGAYADPTAATSALGVLRPSEYDRPVLRFGTSGVMWTRTPALSADDLKSALTVDATIGPDGLVSGTSVISASGPQAIELRDAMRAIEQNGSAAVAKTMQSRQGWAGNATFDTHSPFERGDSFEIKSHFDLTGRMFGDGVAPTFAPTGPRILTRPIESFGTVQAENRRQDFLCRPADYTETIRLKLPAGKTVASLPKGVSVKRELGEYRSSYRLDGNVVAITRNITWRLPNSVCTRQTADDLAAVSRAFWLDTGARLVLVDSKPVIAETVGVARAKDMVSPASDQSAVPE